MSAVPYIECRTGSEALALLRRRRPQPRTPVVKLPERKPEPEPATVLPRARDWLLVAEEFKRATTVKEVIDEAAQVFGVTPSEIAAHDRSVKLVRARHAVCYVAKKVTARSISDIARRLGGRDHTSVLHAVRKVPELIASDPDYDLKVRTLLARVGYT